MDDFKRLQRQRVKHSDYVCLCTHCIGQRCTADDKLSERRRARRKLRFLDYTDPNQWH